nr:unnamed protein product [Callosobruchus analis]
MSKLYLTQRIGTLSDQRHGIPKQTQTSALSPPITVNLCQPPARY